MTEKQKALLEAAHELEERIWQMLEKRLYSVNMDLVRSYMSVFLRRGLLEGTVRAGPEFSRAAGWEDLEELVVILRCRMGELEAG